MHKPHEQSMKKLCALKLVTLTAIFGLSAMPSASADEPTTVSTYHCLSLYWTPDDNGGGQPVTVQYRVTGDTAWRTALPMRYNPVSSAEVKGDYRSSLVNLLPGTSYDISLQVGSSGETALLTAETVSENIPIATSIKVGKRSTTMTVEQNGTPTGYILYDGTGSTIDLNNAQDQGILVKGSYIILRGFTIRDVKKHGIHIESGHHIIIEDCDISQWGEHDENGFGVNAQSGIFSQYVDLHAVTIQRCKIHHPNWDTNSWDEIHDGSEHPAGPQAIAFLNSAGNHVIRYNEFWSDSEHCFNDVIGYGSNASFRGFPGADSDIYGNYFANAKDDGIEAEGGNQNVRIWNNYIADNYIGIGNAATSVGPLYVWRNVIGLNTLYGVKMGFAGDDSWMTGEMYFFNNTVLNNSGGLGTSSNMKRVTRHCTTRNNILHVRSTCMNSISSGTANLNNDYDYDLLSAAYPVGDESHGISGTPTYVNSPLFDDATKTGNFVLASTSLGYDDGVIIPNFGDHYAGSAPDMGAHEEGAPAMVFGVNSLFVPPVINQIPLVTAWPPTQNVMFTEFGTVQGSAVWMSTGTIGVTWSKVSGPGAVVFDTPNALETIVAFGSLGTYVLKLEAADSVTSASKQVTVVFKDNGQPTAMQDPLSQTVAIEAVTKLKGIASDDGLPEMMYLLWSKVSGPGTVTFSDPDLLTTKAAFTITGTYMIKFKALDSLLYGARNSTVIVKNNGQPTVSVTPLTQTISLSGTATLTGSATDDGLPQPLTYSWTPGSGSPGTVTLSNPTGSSTTATFSATGTYTIKFKASDSLLYGARNVTVIVN